MTQYKINLEEWWPVFTLTQHGKSFYDFPACDFSDAEIADIQRIAAEFAVWQKKIAERFGTSTANYEPELVDNEPVEVLETSQG